MRQSAAKPASPQDKRMLHGGVRARLTAVSLLREVFCRQEKGHKKGHKKGQEKGLSKKEGKTGESPPRQARQIASVTLRHLRRIDIMLNACLARPDLPAGVRWALRAAAADLIFRPTPAYAAIHAGVEAVKQQQQGKNFAALANAVLRRLAEMEKPPVKENIPPHWQKRWAHNWGEAALEEIAAAAAAPPGIDIAVKNPAQAEDIARKLGGVLLEDGMIHLPPAAGQPANLPLYEDGVWWVQDRAAAWPVRFFGELRGRTALDLCAAPGGKAAQLAAAGARLTALEPDAARLARLKSNFARLKLKGEFVQTSGELYAASHQQKFDCVLADVPCLGTGALRRRPDLLHLRQIKELPQLGKIQRRLLAAACLCVKPGGLVIYASCSLEPEEGEDLIAGFCGNKETGEKAAPEAYPAQMPANIPADMSTNMELLPIRAGEAGVPASLLRGGLFRVWPAGGNQSEYAQGEYAQSEYAMDGFFAARLIRRK